MRERTRVLVRQKLTGWVYRGWIWTPQGWATRPWIWFYENREDERPRSMIRSDDVSEIEFLYDAEEVDE